MVIGFVGQPFRAHGGWVADQIRDFLNDPSLSRLQLAAAWMKRSGLERLRDDVQAFRERGGQTEAILGIDEGGATAQGLRLAQLIFDEVRIFHDPRRGTFHPKVYLASGPASARLLIGSSNFTAGGLYDNYEAGLVVKLDLGDPEERNTYTAISDWFAGLIADVEVCKVLDDELLDALLAEPRYRIGDEDAGRAGDQLVDVAATASNTDVMNDRFGVSASDKVGRAPAVRRRGQRGNDSTQMPVNGTRTATSRSSRPLATSEVAGRIWRKRLSATDAQHPPGSASNPTGHLKLTKADSNINWKTFFRHDLWGHLDWAVSKQTPRGNQESAIVPFRVIVSGRDLGIYHLRVDHAEFREAGQGNVPTWLHWGLLASELERRDHTGENLSIEELSDGTYQLVIE